MGGTLTGSVVTRTPGERLFVGGDCGVQYLPERRVTPYRVFTGWGAERFHASESEAWNDLADALDGRGYTGLATMARARVCDGS